ncbi:helix-turn-helix domain-containing protein [Pimelobacter simplex]|uniref:helix-turn-helix domain-containing protein n=1 Tax=Nocardioides simplex TaxID=2045 RepID=UPI0021505D46|nr:helix-turn-helix transcriptional regulator [Pimelobacter simplex]UUW88427.1 helix-turn-helix transcriptional regulator [Pimelobacter simplex]UUW97931.1 helix-turn-helix transcriptional regulator [Pimelobacter simplex]
MRVIDPKRILKLMAIQDVSARALAQAVGYSSHSYVTRILRGEITTVTPERAARIARFFGVGVDDLFVPRLSSDTGQSVSSRRPRVKAADGIPA